MSSTAGLDGDLLASMLKIRAAFTESIPNKSETYTIRKDQIEMAERIWLTFKNNESILIEAQTGVGKSNAYLVPIILNADGENTPPVVIATGTKVLQDQLIRTIPFLLEALDKRKVKVAVLKGKGNYLCKYKYEKAMSTHSIPRYLYDKCRTSKEVDDLQLQGPAMDHGYKVVADDDCMGKKCMYYHKCPMIEARKEARKANIIITNHHVAMYDIKYPTAKLLPEYKQIVFDEGHNLPGVMSSVYTRTISQNQVKKLFKEAIDLLPSDERRMRELLEDADDISSIFFDSLMPPTGTSDTSPFLVSQTAFDFNRALTLARLCEEVIRDGSGNPHRYINIFQSDNPEDDDGELLHKANRITEKLSSLAKDIQFISKMHKHFAAWAEYRYKQGRTREKYVVLNYTPLDIGALFQKEFVEKEASVVVVSATLGAGGKAKYFQKILGYDRSERNIDFLSYQSPFDYENNARVFIPQMESKPSSPEYVEECGQNVLKIVNMMDGRSLVLCTSYNAMKTLKEYVESRVSYNCLMQGDMPTRDLVDAFKKDKHSVLFATRSFWEGVDVPGDSLSCVILDKLPFPGQHDPVVKATMEYFEHRSLNSFKMYSIPEAVMLFKQGIGRLIRSEEDKGVMAILDNRVIDSSYAELFQEALPPSPVVRTYEELQDWLTKENV